MVPSFSDFVLVVWCSLEDFLHRIESSQNRNKARSHNVSHWKQPHLAVWVLVPSRACDHQTILANMGHHDPKKLDLRSILFERLYTIYTVLLTMPGVQNGWALVLFREIGGLQEWQWVKLLKNSERPRIGCSTGSVLMVLQVPSHLSWSRSLYYKKHVENEPFHPPLLKQTKN